LPQSPAALFAVSPLQRRSGQLGDGRSRRQCRNYLLSRRILAVFEDAARLATGIAIRQSRFRTGSNFCDQCQRLIPTDDDVGCRRVVLSLLAKEIAVTLPAGAGAILLLVSDRFRRFQITFPLCRPNQLPFTGWCWLSTWVVRTLALGTVSGGYGGSSRRPV